MSTLTIHRVMPPVGKRVHRLLQRLFARESTQGRLYKDLRNLPDHLLLDIGVDPRDVPGRTDEVIARPDLAHGGLATTAHRTVAKS